MEFCDGGDLSNFLTGSCRLPLVTTQRLAIHMAIALYALSVHKIVHRDIKPANILLSITDSKPAPRNITFKLSDFGISRHLDQSKMASTIVGSPVYMAPEVIRGDAYDGRCDLWSLGCVLHEAYMGRSLFDVVDFLRMMAQGPDGPPITVPE